MKRTALHLVLALLAGLLALPAGATNQRKVAFGLQGPFDCTLCHGSNVTGQYWPDGAGGIPAYVDDSAGSAASHAGHVLAIGQYLGYGDYQSNPTGSPWASMYDDTQQKAICGFCHFDPGGSGHTSNVAPLTQVDVIGDGVSPGTFTTFDVAAQAIKPDTHTAGSYATATKTCAAVDCHYEAVTPTYAGAGWDGGNTGDATCETCHFYRDGVTYPTGAYTIGALPDAHQVHVAGIAPPNAAQSKGYPCSYCHLVAGYSTAHVNGAIDLDVTGTPNANLDEIVVQPDLALKYGAGVAPNDADAVCSGIYCHGADFSGAEDGTGGTRGTGITPVWSDHTTGTCGDCHDVDVNGVGSQPFDQGAHTSHIPTASGGVLYGPGFGSHYNNCAICHGFEDPLAGGFCGMCHAPPLVMPGSPGDIGRAWPPSASHVEGNFEVDFAGQDRGWNKLTDPFTAVGTIAPLGTAYNNGTDICNRCHSTALVGGTIGATLAKQEWSGAAHVLPCENCHNNADPAFSQPVSLGSQAPGKDDTSFATRGHGLPSGSTYPWSSARNGAGAVCTDCHANTVAHISGSLGDTDRLSTSGNALCNNCHDGAGTGSAVSQVSTHANTSTTMTNVYTRQRGAMELNCVECHDVHGTANIFMINEPPADGPLVATRLYNGASDTTTVLPRGTVAFTDDSVGTSGTAGVGYAQAGAGNASKICQTCHTQTVHYQYNSDDGHVVTDCITCHKHEFDENYASNSQDGFMPSGCDGCHGYPPVPTATTTPPQENYLGGGGVHAKHVDFLIAKLAIPPTEVQGRSLELCGPCHGQDPLGDHAVSGEAAAGWAIASRAQVNIVARTASSWGDAGTYGGNGVAAPGTKPPGNAVDTTDSRCANLDCHGNADPTEVLHWNVDMTDGAAADDALAASQVCEGCHDQTPAQVRVYNAAGTAQYTGNAPDAAANYYGTVSGYSRGGHGDAEIQNEDPGVDSGTGTTPIDCTACHAAAAAHFPAVAGDLNRLGSNATLETTSHTGLCNDCHTNTSDPRYPSQHHPSFRGTSNNATKDIVVNAASQEVRLLPTRWFEVSTGHYEQDGYSAAGRTGNPDYYVDWWSGSPAGAPEPAPLATLPLLQYVGNQSGPDNTVMCVTCHNPHGTDLYVHDTFGVGAEIPDNNMLRLRDSDNTLCNACH